MPTSTWRWAGDWPSNGSPSYILIHWGQSGEWRPVGRGLAGLMYQRTRSFRPASLSWAVCGGGGGGVVFFFLGGGGVSPGFKGVFNKTRICISSLQGRIQEFLKGGSGIFKLTSKKVPLTLPRSATAPPVYYKTVTPTFHIKVFWCIRIFTLYICRKRH